MCVVEEHIGVDDGVFGIEDGLVHQVAEGAFGPLAHSYAYLEVLGFVGGVLAPVGTEEHIVLAVPLIYFGCPKAVLAPLIAVASVIHLPTGLPVDEVVAHESLESIGHGGAIHVVPAVGCVQQERVTQLHGQRIGDGAGCARFLLQQVARGQAECCGGHYEAQGGEFLHCHRDALG